MKQLNIMLKSIDQVKTFVNEVSGIDSDVFLCSGRYVIDAKSIMGIFSLDLSKPLTVEIENWDEEYMNIFQKYLVK
ncbi:MAG: HPr family phosphocarrier protein [Eubacteriales bacterium]|nr:HPr family phosphocarrier protein [Eubacteriales bacterium]